MRGISSNGKGDIGKLVDDLFDRMTLQLLGDIPSLKYKKWLVFDTRPYRTLNHLFVQAMNNKSPNPIEADALKSLIDSTYSYIEGLKNTTRANLAERMDALAKEAKARKTKIDPMDSAEAIETELNKARSRLKAIVEAESTKLRNSGSMMEISRVASSLGDIDPSVFFVVVRDEVTCEECIKLHLMPDGVTPRIWKFSELKQGYHKRGETEPSAFGLHPHCRCTLTYITQGFGFKDGRITYINQNHDEHASQKS